MSGPSLLEKSENHWVTEMGKWFPSERVVLRGKDIFHELCNMRWMEYLLFTITGRQFTEQQVRLFEGLWSITVSYPDPRIWPNRIAAYAGTVRSTAALGVCAALAISEAELYGHRSNIRTIDFMIRTRKRVDRGESLEEIVREELRVNRWIPGYGRPIAPKDERIDPCAKFARDLGFGNGPHFGLAFAIEDVLRRCRYPIRMNIGALSGCLVADQDLTPEQYHRLAIVSFTAGMIPCFIDADAKTEGTFFPLRCDRLRYEGGSQRRKWQE